MSTRTTKSNLRQIVIRADPDYERLRSRETEYEFPIDPSRSRARIFEGNTEKRGPYADD